MSKNNWLKIKSDYPSTYIPPDESPVDPYWEKMKSLGIRVKNLDRQRCYGTPSGASSRNSSQNHTVDGGICGCNLSMMSNNNKSRYGRLN